MPESGYIDQLWDRGAIYARAMADSDPIASPEPPGGDPSCWLKDFPSDISATATVVVHLDAMHATGPGPLWRLRDPNTIGAELVELAPGRSSTATTVPGRHEHLLVHQDGSGSIDIDGNRQRFGPSGLARVASSQTWTMTAGATGLRWLVIQSR